MQAKLWSINALAIELGRDRASLALDLEGLPPDEQEEHPSGRISRRYRLLRVVEHLYRREGVGQFDSQRERLAAAQAERIERENLVRRGELLEAQHVREVTQEHILAARAKLLPLASKLAPQLVGLNDARVIDERIRREVWDALRELAAWEPAGLAGENAGDYALSGDGVGSAAGVDYQ